VVDVATYAATRNVRVRVDLAEKDKKAGLPRWRVAASLVAHVEAHGKP